MFADKKSFKIYKKKARQNTRNRTSVSINY